jgi:hypothetical protein
LVSVYLILLPVRGCRASRGWNDNDLFVGTEEDIDAVSVDINDSSISTSCYGAQNFCITVPAKNDFLVRNC